MTRPTPAADQQDRAYAANVAALRFHLSRDPLERQAIDVALDLCRVHFAWSQVLQGKAREVA